LLLIGSSSTAAVMSRTSVCHYPVIGRPLALLSTPMMQLANTTDRKCASKVLVEACRQRQSTNGLLRHRRVSNCMWPVTSVTSEYCSTRQSCTLKLDPGPLRTCRGAGPHTHLCST
jgi:hypothetical protein